MYMVLAFRLGHSTGLSTLPAPCKKGFGLVGASLEGEEEEQGQERMVPGDPWQKGVRMCIFPWGGAREGHRDKG